MVTCQLCGKQMKWIQNTHLAKHGYTLAEYRIDFPNSPVKTEEIQKRLERRGQRKPIRFCARKGCGNTLNKGNKYCSSKCNALDNPEVGLHHKGYTTHLNPNYTDGTYSYGKSQKQKAYERDKGKCQRCGCDVGSGTKYGVHHLVPRRLFRDKASADSLDNLVTLCSKDHRDVEAEFVEHLYYLYMNAIHMEPKHLMVYLREKI